MVIHIQENTPAIDDVRSESEHRFKITLLS